MPIYRNKETGHEVEVLPGTRLPRVYEKVDKPADKPKGNESAQTKDVSDKASAKGKGTKPTAKGKNVKENKDESPATDTKLDEPKE